MRGGPSDKAVEASLKHGIEVPDLPSYRVGYDDALRDVVEHLRRLWPQAMIVDYDAEPPYDENVADFIEREFGGGS